jgi:predicted acyl esterase
MRYQPLVSISAFIGFALFTGPAAAQDWVRTDTLIPMRDGIHLFTVIVVPPGATGPLPILMTATPYEASGNGSLSGASA